jgi:aminopeptidase N
MSKPLKTIRLADYRPPAFLVEGVALQVELDPVRTLVEAVIELRRNAQAAGDEPLRLDGRGLELLAIELDGRALEASAYIIDEEGLTIPAAPQACRLMTRVAIDPDGNTALEGLYRAAGTFCTQCEAQGFRKITFYPDRPDVMARFTVTLIGDPQREPVLLTNGNLVAAGRRDDGRHFATFEDPFPKPSYLFALVAGDLARIDDRYTTLSGRQVTLQIFVEERNRYKCDHAMASLKNAMRWDEQTFGLEYDLDEYKIVAVDDFNMGAMENKGLNVFNSKYVLADPETATDADFQGVEGVIGHEYFHNWTGNRVTCRDWFQLSLKEGLTVFRDQQFSAAMGSAAVKRISDVRLLRSVQFPEDAGPMAHPVRPEAYVEINNFYTATVYNKGAEVIRIYHTLLGAAGFRSGLALYFERHDGQAVTTDDFLAAMADANGRDLSQLKRWYSQAGTPQLEVRSEYDAESAEYHLHVRQSCADTPGQSDQQPFLVPLRVGLLGPDGKDLPLRLKGEQPATLGSRVLVVSAAQQSFTFSDIGAEPVPSLLRGFSAPVQLDYPYGREQLTFLFAHDSDPFNRWEAGQRLATELLLEMAANADTEVPQAFVDAFRAALVDSEADPALRALALTLPGETELAEAMGVADPGAIHAARQGLRRHLAEQLAGEFRSLMATMQERGLYTVDAAAIGRRSLKNLCLAYLTLCGDHSVDRDCFDRFADADNMSDRMAALTCLVHNRLPQWQEALAAFYHRFEHDPLVVDKWFALQATAPGPETLVQVERLMQHLAFTVRNPNRVRALIGAFAHGNPACYHDAAGRGYVFLADRVLELDPLNPQVAARMVTALARWRRFDSSRQQLMRAQLERIRGQAGLSNDVGEIVSKSLG